MFCMNCGHVLPNEAKFCMNCGVPKGQTSRLGTTTSEAINSNNSNTSVNANYPKIGDEIIFGNDCGSKIYWKVLKLHEHQALIISTDIIRDMPYHKTGASVMWEECSLRRWLNKDFYNDCFTQDEKAKILLSKNDNSNNPHFNTRGGVQTSDSIFLLSLSEALQLFYNSEERANNAWWWLRTPGNYPDRAVCVYGDGEIDICGSFVGEAIGVRPALWMKLD